MYHGCATHRYEHQHARRGMSARWPSGDPLRIAGDERRVIVEAPRQDRADGPRQPRRPGHELLAVVRSGCYRRCHSSGLPIVHADAAVLEFVK